MKKWCMFGAILVLASVYHWVFDDIESRMLDTFYHAKVGEVYNLSDFTKGSIYSFWGIDYIDFRQPMDIENSMENIILWHAQEKQKIIYSHLDSDGETSKKQVFLEADRSRRIPFGYRCPPNAQIQLVHIETESQLYDITPLNCQSLDE